MSTSTPVRPDQWGVSPDPGLIGREHELTELRGLLATRRLVTITGPGGVGKTRLATAVVDGVDGSVVCELAPVPDPGGVPAAIAESLGFPSIDAAALGWSDRSGLLLVDNAEHHVDIVAEVVDQLLGACASLTVLVTSREPLELPDEHVIVLAPLALPAEDDALATTSAPAVQLFLARAREAGADLPLDDDAVVSAVAAITRRLDGLPLALELAAARTRSLNPQDILRHLDARFELLTRRRERGPERQRSLEATIGWSYERLEPSQQRFFARLGAFCGPFTLEAARTVAAEPDESATATLDRLDALVSRSLIAPVPHGAETSYLLPESVRLYARRQLDEAAEADVCDARCVDHYVRLAIRLVEQAQRAWSSEVVRTLFAAQLNLQDAIRWCLVTDPTPARATALFLPLWGLVHNARAENVRSLGEQILERWPQPEDAGWAATAAITATATLVVGDVERARELITLVSDAGHTGVAGVIAGRAAYLAASHEGDDASALRHLDAAAAIAEAERLEPFAIELEVFRALTRARSGDLTGARAAADRARARADAVDGELLQVFARLVAGAVATDDPDRARSLLGDAAELARRSHYPWGSGAAHCALGALALASGDPVTARTELERSLETFLAAGQLGEAMGTMRWISGLLAAAGRRAAAVEVLVPVAPSSPYLAVLEERHLAPLLAGLVPAAGRDLRSAIAAARAHLAEPILETSPPGDAPSAAPEEPPGPPASWVNEGAVWALTYAGRTVRLPDAKGLADLATLLARPGREVPATELMGAGVESSDLGPVLDATARRRYEQRIIELQEDLEEAEGFGDLRRAEVAREELDQLIDGLAAATGLGGRDRRQGDSGEKARSAVTRRIRDTIRRISGVHPPLGDHLEASVRTGRWCVYAPPEPVDWAVATGP